MTASAATSIGAASHVQHEQDAVPEGIRAAYEDKGGFVNAKNAGSGVNIPSNQRNFTDGGFGNPEALRDDTDRRIAAELQNQPRMRVAELARRTGSTASSPTFLATPALRSSPPRVSGYTLSPWAGFALYCGYTAVILAAAALALRSRDA